MINPNSRTDALRVFEEKMRETPLSHIIVLQLGEVDCGFVIWYYAEKFSVPIADQLGRSLSNYGLFLKRVKEKGYNNVIVLSAPLPTIADGQNWGEIANARREIKASLRERTVLTIRYNQLLGNVCKQNNVIYIDTTPNLLDVKSGTIKSGFLNSDKADHHLNQTTYSRLICDILRDKLHDII